MDDERKQALGLVEAADETGETRELYLRDGRTLSVSGDREQLVEIRAASGQLELRIRLTEQGPVLQMDAVRMELRASESVAVETKQFTVNATESVALASQGSVAVTSTGETTVKAEGDVVVVGKTIHLN